MMKQNYFITLLLFTVNLTFSQQNKSGVYLTVEDYRNNKLSYDCSCEHRSKIKINEAFNPSHIIVKTDGERRRLHKDSIYAVQLCNKPLIRFQNKETFYLSEKGGVWIYFTEQYDHQEKTTVVNKIYYFSVGESGILKPLTVTNIKYAFPEKEKFHDLLDEQFKTEDASDYDKFHKMFKINHLIKFSLN
jgi:hypothetical protein